jgi:hypothetical protein
MTMTIDERADVQRRLFLLRRGWQRRPDGGWEHPRARGAWSYSDDDTGLAAAERNERAARQGRDAA